jgi:RNA polymerase sigma-70 factor (ECF subfamily)
VSNSNLDIVLKEKQLFQDFQAGNLAVFDYFFDRYYQGLCIYAHRLLKSTSEAEDLVEDFFVRILENRKNIRIERSVKSYFIRSVHNRCLDFIAHQQVIIHNEEYLKNRFSEAEFQDYPLINRELEQRLNLAIQNLPNGIRETFLLNRFDGMKYQQIAARENISVKTVEYRISKALALLRKELGEYLALLLLLSRF